MATMFAHAQQHQALGSSRQCQSTGAARMPQLPTRRPLAPLAPAASSSSGSSSSSSSSSSSFSSSSSGSLPSTSRRASSVLLRAQAEGKATLEQQQNAPQPDWVPVCRPEDLPKGVRKELEIDGRQVLMFWYRNQIYCIQARSPAEGAYSEGFIKAKFTQDYAIECPSTASLFSLNDGSIKAWYPNNSVLRALTPQNTCPRMEIFPVKLTQEAISVDVSGAQFRGPAGNRGGAGSSIDNNNVFSMQPTVYFDGMDPAQERATPLMTPNAKQGIQPAVVVLAIATAAAVGAVGYAIYRYISLP